MFSYEEEVRIVFYDEKNKTGATDGVRLDFDFEHLIESVRVYPEADKSFFDAVQNIVKTYAQNYMGNVAWSDMKLGPPF